MATNLAADTLPEPKPPRQKGIPALDVLKAVYEGRTGLTGGPLQLLTALVLRADCKWEDPREPGAFRMTLAELAELALTSTSSVDRWRRELRRLGHLQFKDAEGCRRSTEYTFHCNPEAEEPAPPLVSQSDETFTQIGASVSQSDETNAQSDETTKETARASLSSPPDPPDPPTPQEGEQRRERAGEYVRFKQDVSQHLLIAHGFVVHDRLPPSKPEEVIKAAFDRGVSAETVIDACKAKAAEMSEGIGSINFLLPYIAQAGRPAPVARQRPHNDRGMLNQHSDHVAEAAMAKATRERARALEGTSA